MKSRRQTRWGAIGMSVGLLPVLGGCVTVAEFRKLEDEVVRMRKSDGPVGDRARLADLSAELGELRGQVEDLRGRVEVGEHTSNKALEEAQSARRDAASRDSAPPPPARDLTGGAPPGVGATSPVAAGEAARMELDAYREAYDAWRVDENPVCIDRFRDFLQTYPSSSYADAAAYWMADCYYKQGDYQTAILRFDDVASRYPKSDKAPEALYRQGEALLQLGPSYGGAAGKAFERVIQEYPGSKRAQEAEQQLGLIKGP